MIESIPSLCGSVAAKPGPLDIRLHNAGYDALGLSFRYVALGVDNVEPVLTAVKTLGFRGLSVSMPFKQVIIPLLDRVDDDVAAIGACNTVVIASGKTTGYNTDWVGAVASLEEAEVADVQRAVIIGAGGVARAIAFGLKRRGVEVFIAARSEGQRTDLVRALELDGEMDLHKQGDADADLVVNATPDASNIEGAVELNAHKRAYALLDVVFANRVTPLVKAARERGWQTAPGWRMLLHQALGQFRLYTGEEPPMETMAQVLDEVLPN